GLQRSGDQPVRWLDHRRNQGFQSQLRLRGARSPLRTLAASRERGAQVNNLTARSAPCLRLLFTLSRFRPTRFRAALNCAVGPTSWIATSLAVFPSAVRIRTAHPIAGHMQAWDIDQFF